MQCWLRLPRTHFHLDAGNPVCQVFWGRARLVFATAFFFYVRGNRVQRLIHSLKYKGNKDLGVYLGEQYGQLLREVPLLADVHAIIPVPLHPKKMRKRGFNQSEVIADGLGKSLQIPVNTGLLIRNKATDTQTRKTRYHRWENVEHIFSVVQEGSMEGKHLLLVDDVITTGSTVEACIHALMRIPGVRVSVVAVAYASR